MGTVALAQYGACYDKYNRITEYLSSEGDTGLIMTSGIWKRTASDRLVSIQGKKRPES